MSVAIDGGVMEDVKTVFDLNSRKMVVSFMNVFKGMQGDMFAFVQFLKRTKIDYPGACINNSMDLAAWFYVACFNFPDLYLRNKGKMMGYLQLLTGDNYTEVRKHFMHIIRVKPILLQLEA